jgi:lysophospholipase L1-like esterase
MKRIGTSWIFTMSLTIHAVFTTVYAADRAPLEGVRRVVFLGDSITYAGGYIDYLETYLSIENRGLRYEFLNLGLPSETVSGLSEPGHAGGQFPRPDLHERLDRVLEQTRPELIVACYGMNDGIYYPYSQHRAAQFERGIRFLRERAAKSGARVLLLTPPVFDPVPIKAQTLPDGLAEYRQPFEGYDGVLARYSNWLLARRQEGWDVVDIHTPMKSYLEAERKRDPKFRLADDGVHINLTGHWIIAREILVQWGIRREVLGDPPHFPTVLELVSKRQAILKDAWLTATGHKRPGMSKGMPLPEAQQQAQELARRIHWHLVPVY